MLKKAAAPGSDAGAAAELPPPAANANFAQVILELSGSRQSFVIKLRPDLAPKHVANFKKLAHEGYYDGLAVHRAIRGYLVQMGDPLTRDDDNKKNWGTGGPDYKIAPEIKGTHKRGTVAAARLSDALNPDKASSGSQFYIMLRGAKSLDAGYSVFGEVTRGLDVLDSLAAQVVDTNDVPVKRVEIKSVRLLSAGDPALSEQKKSVRKTVPEHEKGPITKWIERFW